ncbi:MAG TPA: HAD family hydrolase [Longimicrobiaceae bacterium]
MIRSKKAVRAVILDVDGTLLYSNEAHARAFVEAARQMGIDPPAVDEVLRLIGMGADKLIPRAFGFEQDDPQGEELEERKGNIFRSRYLQSLEPTPEVRALLERLKADGYALVVATSASPDELDGLLQRAGVRDLIEDATSADEVDESKPEPDVVHAALQQARVAPHEAVMIGDTPYDVEAARAAGVTVIALRTGGWSEKDLSGAIAVYADPAELLDRYAESPLGRRGAGSTA